LTGNEPLSELPKPPSHFDKYEKELWNIYASYLAGKLKIAHLTTVQLVCEIEGRMNRMRKELKKINPNNGKPVGELFKTKNGYIQQHPAVTMMQKDAALLLRWKMKLGLTPHDEKNLSGELPLPEDEHPLLG